MTAALDAIRTRDAEADRCAKCGYTAGGPAHDETVEQCNARNLKASKGERGCWEPNDHHPYEPGGIADYDSGSAADRRALLAALDRAEAAYLASVAANAALRDLLRRLNAEGIVDNRLRHEVAAALADALFGPKP